MRPRGLPAPHRGDTEWRCATVDDALVWQFLGDGLPRFEKILRSLLEGG